MSHDYGGFELRWRRGVLLESGVTLNGKIDFNDGAEGELERWLM
jgi:hypothetical protein